MSEEREIVEIPARANGEDEGLEKLRVSSYCRVSTNQEAQQNSYQAQKAYYPLCNDELIHKVLFSKDTHLIIRTE